MDVAGSKKAKALIRQSGPVRTIASSVRTTGCKVLLRAERSGRWSVGLAEAYSSCERTRPSVSVLSSADFAAEIVHLGSGNPDIHKLADWGTARQQYSRVHLRCVSRAAAYQRLFDERLDLRPDHVIRKLCRNFLLQPHRPTITRVLYRSRQLSAHFSGTRTFLLGVSKYSQTLKSRSFNKLQQRFKILLCFSRKSDNECSPQRNARYCLTKCLNQIFDMLARSLSSHQLQPFLINMLQRHVNESHYFRAGGDRFHQLSTPMRRMGVEKPHPKISRDSF